MNPSDKERLLAVEEGELVPMEGIPVVVSDEMKSSILVGIPVDSQPQSFPVEFYPELWQRCRDLSPPYPQQPQQEWNAHLCDCANNCCTDSACCYGTWCTPCMWGESMAKFDGSDCYSCCALMFCAQMLHKVLPCVQAVLGGHKRTEIRKLFGIRTCCFSESCGALEDIMCHLPCCHCCATIQEFHMLNATGATAQQPATMLAYGPVVMQPDVVMVQPGGVMLVSMDSHK